MTGKLLAYHLKSPRVPLVVRVPQFENHCSKAYRKRRAFYCHRSGERIPTSSAFLKCLKCAKAREKLTFLMRCKRERILLPSNRRKQVDFDLLIEQQNRYLRDDFLKLKEIAKGDTEAWKKLNYNERCAVYRERDKTKLIFIKKFRWIREKHPKHVNNKRRRKNARVTQRYRKRIRLRKMQDVLAKADEMILNKSSLKLDDYDKFLLCKRLRFAPTSNWSKSVENAEWINAWQHVRRTEWNAVLGEKDDTDFVLPKNYRFPKPLDQTVPKLIKKPKHTWKWFSQN